MPKQFSDDTFIRDGRHVGQKRPALKVTVVSMPFSDTPVEAPRDSKSQAGYMSYPEGGFRCDNCLFFRGEKGEVGECSKVAGAIEPDACCNHFQPPEEGDEE